jgi:UDP-N-acetylglucosamine--N-acetylmuramyl-(pentapeptide) pyrophosphoryl-undecaprenol N-acetylglucosamine transferase
MKVAFTGGGSAGHVTPNLALIQSCLAHNIHVIYLGRDHSIESDLLASHTDVLFCAITSERLRRYFSWKNFIMPFYVVVGILQAFLHLRQHKPNVLFSKGGFVTLPVVIAAWMNRIPIIIHESDANLGLANRLSLPFAQIVCVAQARATNTVKHKNVRHTGSPVRLDFLHANPEQAMIQFKLDPNRKVLLVFGGSQGSAHINQCVRDSLNELLAIYQVVHVCGTGALQEDYAKKAEHRYHQYEYIKQGFADLLACAHLVIARAGANGIAELQAVHTPALLIPLSTQSSRGDQWLNAEAFVEAGLGQMISNEDLNKNTLLNALEQMEIHRDSYQNSFIEISQNEGTISLMKILNSFDNKNSFKTSI